MKILMRMALLAGGLALWAQGSGRNHPRTDIPNPIPPVLGNSPIGEQFHRD